MLKTIVQKRMSTGIIAPRITVAHSSWFRVPDQGMEEFDVLARGTGFFVHGRRGGVAALFSAHVSAPYAWRQYFPEEFLDFVEDRHCQNRFNICGETMSFSAQDVVRDETHDAAAYSLQPEEIDMIRSANIDILSLDNDEIDADTKILLSGHELRGGDCGSGEEHTEAVDLSGSVVDRIGSRIFVRTDDGLTQLGMCGGPAVRKGEKRRCIGLLEGRVEGGPCREKGAHRSHPVPREGQSALVPVEVLREIVNGL